MICREFEELSGAYALNAVTAEERRQAEKHLAQCPLCTRRLQELRSVVELLAMPMPGVEPSPTLKKRILATIVAQKSASIQVPPRSTPLPVQPVSTMLAAQRRRPQMSLAVLVSAAILMLILMSGMIIWNISLQQQLVRRSTGTTQNYVIHGTAANAEAIGQLSYFPEQDLTILVMYGLPTPEGHQVYQGWLLQGGDPISMGLLDIQNGVATISFQGPVYNYDTTAISLEAGPTASKDAPGGRIVAQGALKT